MFLPDGYEYEVPKSKVDDDKHRVLKDKKTVITRAHFWKIHHDSNKEDINLKLGRYIKQVNNGYETGVLETENPKSELTLDDEEFAELIKFLSKEYEPFKLGIKKYISLDDSFNGEGVDYLKAMFSDPDKQKMIELILENNILPEDLMGALDHIKKNGAVAEFECMLNQDLLEKDWQKWLKINNWVLGSEFVKILDERVVDTRNIADFLMQAYDGFLDIVEIKRPSSNLKFWADDLDHGNYYPSVALTKAVAQSSSYINEVEREIDSDKFITRVGGVKIVKPRCVLIFGRSNSWNDAQKRAYRVLNAGYSSLTILTYDHVLARAKSILNID